MATTPESAQSEYAPSKDAAPLVPGETLDDTRDVLDRAWGRIPHTHETSAGLGSFTRLRIERILSLAIGAGTLVLGLQAFLFALGPNQEFGAWQLPFMLIAFVPLAAMLVACAVGRGVATASATFALAYPIVLILSPIATAGKSIDPAILPWTFYLVSVATAATVLAFPLKLQIVWTAFVPLLFGVVRLIQGNFAQKFWFSVALDVSFALILGGIIVALVWLFRAAATNVDETRARAVESYALAAAADAAEQERLAIAALMHDSVLAALIAAERAHTPRERSLAVAMAREALTRLANTEQSAAEGSDEPKDVSHIGDDIERAARELGVDVVLQREIVPGPASVPGRVARALVLATTQAIANAAEHADGIGLAVTIEGESEPPSVRISIRDTGSGFDFERIPHDRLGIRASIIARVAAVGGVSSIDSDHGGTTVRLAWTGAAS